MDIALAWSWMQVLNKRRYDAICDVFGGLEKALELVGEPMLRELGMTEVGARAALLRLDDFDAERERRRMEQDGIRFLTIEDADYPSRLGHCGDPPIFLYAKGDMSILDQPCVGIVGTRGMTAYGERATEHFIPAFVRAEMTTVSGLAEGVDTVVAKETLRAGGKTAAVLGHGFGMMFPASNRKLAEEIVASGGLLLTEFAYDIHAGPMTFPARNRIVAGLSLGVVVTEAPLKSGALITADLALEDGRDVFAVPGPIFEETYAGCHMLIASGRAKLVGDPADVLGELGVIAREGAPADRPAYQPANDDEKAVYDILTSLPQPVDDIVERTGLPPPRVGVALTMMELAGAVRNVGGGRWIRI
jgi:DNA processing protein